MRVFRRADCGVHDGAGPAPAPITAACSIHSYASLIFLGTVISATEEPGKELRDVFRLSDFGSTRHSSANHPYRNFCEALPEFREGRQFLLFALGETGTPMVGSCSPVIPIAETSDHLVYRGQLLAHHVATEVYGPVYAWKSFPGLNCKPEQPSGVESRSKVDSIFEKGPAPRGTCGQVEHQSPHRLGEAELL